MPDILPPPPGFADLAAIVLAAGKSTRMRSRLPKVLHPVCGRPILAHILHALAEAGITRRIAVIGHEAETVRQNMDDYFGAGTLEYALQTEQKGTGHAVQMAQAALHGFTGTVLVLAGDTPLLSAEVLKLLLAEHSRTGATATVLTAVLPDAGAYGRIIRGDGGEVLGIVENKDATPEQKAIREINTGVFAFDAPALFAALSDLSPANAQGEYYLTDVLAILRGAGKTVRAVVTEDTDVILGVNTRVELAEIAAKMRSRILRDLMLSGVTVEDPATTYVDAGVTVGQDSVLEPMTKLCGDTQIGANCVIRLGTVIADSTVGDGCKVGPFAHIRPGSTLAANVKIGNFVEVNRSELGEKVSAAHLTYLGDATVGANTNIGAGTITCNYDGFNKSRTVIGEDAFIGSHSTLIAPLTIESGALTAAGSVITQNVPANAIAVGRSDQKNLPGAEARRRKRLAIPSRRAENAVQSGSEPKP
ncbi:MAG: bifunctional UDP-N-acetylglucosamine diphosphorylase/glucosamine-1-phosphate N-acetyltransferase GlmU [Armatimonadetes bacterium]|nr:bifunctional UDP-N-acetylglucosamine diphosphorylase/glucosamine-1-phosphate N-acetyltransferase GlmU [Armatimonadota bacterium]